MKAQLIYVMDRAVFQRMARLLLPLSTAVIMLAFVILPMIYWHEELKETFALYWDYVNASFIIYLVVAGAFIITRGKLLPRRDFSDITQFVICTLVIAAILAGVTWSCQSSSGNCKKIFVASSILVWAISSSVCTILLSTGFLAIFRRRSMGHFPLQYLCGSLVHAIWLLERAGTSWAEPQTRSRILKDLDQAAHIIRHDLFRGLNTTDRAGWFWREERARLISNAVYDKQRWLMTPMADTRAKLLDYLAETLVSVLTGQWDRLETSEGLSVTRAQTLYSGAQIAKAVFTGLLPLGSFVLARRYGIVEIASPVADYATLGLILWTVLSVGIAIDPTLTEKTSAMRDVLSVIPGLGKKGGKE